MLIVYSWAGLRVDLLSCLFTAGLATYMVYFVGVTNAANVGFSINMAGGYPKSSSQQHCLTTARPNSVAFSSMIIWWVRIMNEFEIQGEVSYRQNARRNLIMRRPRQETGKEQLPLPE